MEFVFPKESEEGQVSVLILVCWDSRTTLVFEFPPNHSSLLDILLRALNHGPAYDSNGNIYETYTPGYYAMTDAEWYEKKGFYFLPEYNPNWQIELTYHMDENFENIIDSFDTSEILGGGAEITIPYPGGFQVQSSPPSESEPENIIWK